MKSEVLLAPSGYKFRLSRQAAQLSFISILCLPLPALASHPTAGIDLCQVSLRPRERFWDIPVPKIDSAFDSLFVPRPSRSLALRDN
ncbi:MAG: hypothetical protein JMN24_18240, partial [gamma proteobacterium endosymbiont of Lamellibrachia anaximandri]|nr:hypothetical protein [gamma proteobacterium endosymbiont of Lamellibrachia anaximandri]